MLASPTARKSEPSGGPATPGIGTDGTATPDGLRIVESRFGTLRIAPENMLRLPNGLLGFAGHQEYGLAALPEGRHPQFRVLQCLTDQQLAFLVAPLNLESGAIDETDLGEACATLGIPRNRAAVLLIVTVRRDENGAHVSVNMRAPLFVDAGHNVARQYVIPNNKYSIRHAL